MAFRMLYIRLDQTCILPVHLMLVREWLLSASGYQRILIIPCNYVKVPLILSPAHTHKQKRLLRVGMMMAEVEIGEDGSKHSIQNV